MIDKEEIYNSLIYKHGKTGQLIVLFEELAELQKEICKDLRGKGNNRECIAEEVADVLICCEQVMKIYGISDNVDSCKEYKINRLYTRLLRGEE